jgi:Bacterial SH3 domain
MATNQPPPENVRLRYQSAGVFERADTRSREIAQLGPGDPFTVLGTEGDYYQVRLANGTLGYIWVQNLTGSNMPLTTNEQAMADERAAAAVRPPTGWRGVLHRLRGTQ